MIRIEFYQTQYFESFFTLFGEWDKNVAFDKKVFEDSLNLILEQNRSKILLALDGEKLLGYAQITPIVWLGFEPYIELDQLLVAEDCRGKGIGKELLKKVEEIALSEDIRVIKLSSQVQRTKTHLFYENFGYQYTKISKFYEKKI